MEHARRCVGGGRTLQDASREAGIGYETLRRWLAHDRADFRPVSLAPAAAAPPAAVVVLLPGGLRVEGLDLDGIAELARRLR